MNEVTLPEFLQDGELQLLLFGGKGGVGKTTCAAAAAMHLAQTCPADSFLLVSTDPAHSLVNCFAGDAPPANLTLCEIDPEACLARFKTRHAKYLRTIALRGTFLESTDVAQLLDLSIPGLDEMMALLEIEAWVKGARYRCVVVDTAPAGHTLRLLGLPALMRQWIQALEAMLAKHRYLAQLYGGTYRKDAVDLYLEETLADLSNLWALLQSPGRCRFVPVMLAEALSIHVTRVMLEELARLDLPVREVVVNRLRTAQADCPVCAESWSRQTTAIKEITQVLSTLGFWGLPLFLDEVRGTDRLLRVWYQARRLSHAAWRDAAETLPDESPATLVRPPLVSRPVPLPAASTRLLMFAGKGGVGKTTLACATALRLAQERGGKEILLFSIDPAHSLGACLGLSIGNQITRVASGLSVIELNAQAEYDGLKQQYADELTGVFDRAGGQSGMDVVFDREVIERMLDLAPPGLDEMLALTRVVDLLDRKQYDLLVLDTAPTGHLIRFLEMPELIDKWLKTFFAIFLKYRKVFWLPKISAFMVDLSKRIKVFRRLLTDAQQAALVVVTIPTEMALLQTSALVGACERLGMSVRSLLVNLVTPATACPACSVLHRAQQPVLARYQTAYAGLQMAQVFRQREPHGLDQLRLLGQALYRSGSVSDL